MGVLANHLGSWLTWEMNISFIGRLALLHNVAVLGTDTILGEVTSLDKVALARSRSSVAMPPLA
jgi:hypothetical protein